MEGVGSGEGPGPDLELSVAVTAGGDDGAVAAEPHSMGRSRRDGYDVAPSAHLALTGFRAAGGDDGAISPEPYTVAAARRHSCDFGPALAAHPELGTSDRMNDSVLRQADGVEVARGHRTYPTPVVHLALTRGVVADRVEAPIGPNGRRVPVAAADIRDLAPAVDLPLPLGIAAGRHQCSVVAQAQCVGPPGVAGHVDAARRDGDDVPPP